MARGLYRELPSDAFAAVIAEDAGLLALIESLALADAMARIALLRGLRLFSLGVC
jgi:hypothetical protein